MRRMCIFAGTIIVSAILGLSVSAEEVTEEWTLEQTVDEFGDITENSVFSYRGDGDFSNTATNSSPLKVVIAYYPESTLFGFNLYEYENTLATYYDNSNITMKIKVDNSISEFKLFGDAPNGMLQVCDSLINASDLDSALENVKNASDLNRTKQIAYRKIPFEESGAQQLFYYLYNNQELKCIIYIDNSKYNFTISPSGFSDLYNEGAYTAALELFENGDFENALYYFDFLGDYKDSSDYVKKCQENEKAKVLAALGLEDCDIETFKKFVDIFRAIYNGEDLGEERVKFVQDHIHDLPLVDDNVEYLYNKDTVDTKACLLCPYGSQELFAYPINAVYDYNYISYQIKLKGDYYSASTYYKVDGETTYDYYKHNDIRNWIIEASDGILLWKNDDVSSFNTLETGSNGEDVQRLQQALIEQGFLSGSADGIYGSGTSSAVASFQKSNGLEETGIADNTTQKTLFNVKEGLEYKDRLYRLYDGFYFVEHEEGETGNIEYQLYIFTKLGERRSFSCDKLLEDLQPLLE